MYEDERLNKFIEASAQSQLQVLKLLNKLTMELNQLKSADVAELQRLKAMSSDTAAHFGQIEGDLSATQGQIDVLKKAYLSQRDLIKNSYAGLNTEVSSVRGMLQAETDKLNSLHDELKGEGRKLGKLHDALVARGSKHDADLKAHFDKQDIDMREKFTAVANNVKDVSSEISELEGKLGDLDRRMHDAAMSEDNNLTGLSDKVVNLNTELVRVSSHVNDIREHVEKQNFELLQASLNSLNDHLPAIEKRISKDENASAELKRNLVSLVKMLKGLEVKDEASMERVEVKIGKVEEKLTRVSDSLAKYADKQAVALLKDKVDVVNTALKDFKVRLKRKEQEHLSESVNDLMAGVRDMQRGASAADVGNVDATLHELLTEIEDIDIEKKPGMAKRKFEKLQKKVDANI